jgi:hypothetical protein
MRFLTLLVVGMMTVACGGNPTQPTIVATAPASTTQSGEPTPAPPAPPTPAPSPTPTPAPPPAPAGERWQGTAVVSNAHWYQTPAPIAESFTVQLTPQTVTFGSMTTPALSWDAKDGSIGVFARPSGMNLQIVFDPATGKGTWTLSGEPGQATGSMTVTK